MTEHYTNPVVRAKTCKRARNELYNWADFILNKMDNEQGPQEVKDLENLATAMTAIAVIEEMDIVKKF